MLSRARGQVALEYIATSSWALIAMLIMIGAMLYIGLFRPSVMTENSCLTPSGFNSNYCILNLTANYGLDLAQSTDHTINVTAVRCTDEREPAMNSTDELAVPVILLSGRHALVTNGAQRCYTNQTGTIQNATGSEGSVFKGRIFVKYTETDTLMQHIIRVDATMKYENVTVPTS